MTESSSGISLADQIAEIEREIALRERRMGRPDAGVLRLYAAIETLREIELHREDAARRAGGKP